MTIMTKRSRGRPRQLDRQRALETALDLFWRYGYEGTSIADLTASMEVTPPSLYAAFGSKKQLYREVLDFYSASYGSYVERALVEEPSARAAVERILTDGLATYLHQDGPRGCVVASAMLTGATENQEMVAELTNRRLAVTGVIKNRLDRAAAEGELAEGTDTATLAAFYAAIIQGMSVQAHDGASEATLRGLIAVAMTAWPAV
jgi:AcrR family transcriptional regulator